MVTIIFEARAENGRYELNTGEPYTEKEKMAAMGIFARLGAMVRQTSQITRTIRVEIDGGNVEVKKEGDFVNEDEAPLVRRQLAHVITKAEQDLALG